MKVTHVEFTYFKNTGKYYSSGEIDLTEMKFYEALEHVRGMLNRGERPGLVNGFEFHVLVRIFTEYGPLSHLFVRREGAPL